MTNLNIYKIHEITEKLLLSDGSSVKSRSSKIIISNNNIGFSIDVRGIQLLEANKVRKVIVDKIINFNAFEKISVVLTSSNSKLTSNNPKLYVNGIKEIVVIAAGKGGVGKSTVATLLAYKLASEGKAVGILDADIYGPSIPHILNLQGKPSINDKKMTPLERDGIKVNSIGFLVEPGASVSWRGPMVSKALYQLISITNWGILDYLIIDTPPGTGDIHLSLLTHYIINGVIMVTSPQQVSGIDVVRSIKLYKKFKIPIFGIIENMSYYIDQNSNQRIKIFTGNSGRVISQENDVPMLAKIPITPDLSTACDLGESLKSFTSLIKFNIPHSM